VTEDPAPDPLPRLAPALIGAARRFGTPVQVTDAVELEAAAAAVRSAFPDPWLRAFSVKANDVAAVVRRVAALGFDANVVSRGEWAIARRAGLPNDRITLEGVGKTDDDLRAAVRAAASGAPLRWSAIESLDEARALVGIAARSLGSARLDVLFRLNPEVAPETLRELAVGAAGSKFGMTADELSEAVEAWAFRLVQDERQFLDRRTAARRWFEEEYLPALDLATGRPRVLRRVLGLQPARSDVAEVAGDPDPRGARPRAARVFSVDSVGHVRLRAFRRRLQGGARRRSFAQGSARSARPRAPEPA